VAALRREYDLPDYHEVQITVGDSIAGITENKDVSSS
jgi:hypothetical protein